MKIYLETAIFKNRSPFNKLELEFSENEIAVLSAINGKGKTTIISHLADAFYEMAKPHFTDIIEDKSQYYRVSSALFNLKKKEPSFVYFRFKIDGETVDYVDIINHCTKEQYSEAI